MRRSIQIEVVRSCWKINMAVVSLEWGDLLSVLLFFSSFFIPSAITLVPPPLHQRQGATGWRWGVKSNDSFGVHRSRMEAVWPSHLHTFTWLFTWFNWAARTRSSIPAFQSQLQSAHTVLNLLLCSETQFSCSKVPSGAHTVAKHPPLLTEQNKCLHAPQFSITTHLSRKEIWFEWFRSGQSILNVHAAFLFWHLIQMYLCDVTIVVAQIWPNNAKHAWTSFCNCRRVLKGL